MVFTGAGWTDERIGLLTTLWNEGKSASECARTIGGVTRNSCIAKVHRLRAKGVQLRGETGPAEPRKAAAPKPAAPRRTVTRIAMSPAVAPVMPAHLRPEAEPVVPFDETPGQATILTLGHRACRWPIGDPRDASFTLCGGRADGPYCERHTLRAYQPLKARHSPAEMARSLRRYV